MRARVWRSSRTDRNRSSSGSEYANPKTKTIRGPQERLRLSTSGRVDQRSLSLDGRGHAGLAHLGRGAARVRDGSTLVPELSRKYPPAFGRVDAHHRHGEHHQSRKTILLSPAFP